MESTNSMIDYNLIVYIGIVLMVLIFILFIANEIDKRKKDIELFKQQQLSKSFEKGKNNERNKIRK